MNRGRIKSLNIPKNWQLEEGNEVWSDRGASTSFHPAGRDNVQLCLYDRGYELTGRGASLFKHLLQSPIDISPSANARDAAKLESLKAMGLNDLLDIMALPDVFRIDTLATRAIGGQRLLQVEGQFMSGGKKCRSYLFPQTDSYKWVQEMFYSGDENVYDLYLIPAFECMETVDLLPLQSNVNC